MNQRCEFHWCFKTRCNFTKHTICMVNCGMQTCFKFAILVLNYSSASLICYMFSHCFMYVPILYFSLSTSYVLFRIQFNHFFFCSTTSSTFYSFRFPFVCSYVRFYTWYVRGLTQHFLSFN